MSEETAVLDPQTSEVETIETSETTNEVPADGAVPAPPKEPAPWAPTGQQVNIAKHDPAFDGTDLRTKAFVMLRQEGTPSVQKAMVPTKQKVTDAEGNVTVQDVQKEVLTVTYTWSDEAEQLEDAKPSLTAALRRQAELAKACKEDGLNVKEDLQKEYGVWYATDPKGEKTGYRFHIGLTEAPPKPPKKTDEEKEAAKLARQQASEAKKAERAQAKSLRDSEKAEAAAARAAAKEAREAAKAANPKEPKAPKAKASAPVAAPVESDDVATEIDE